jgi:hypothetical protein
VVPLVQTEDKVVTLAARQGDGLAGAVARDRDAVMPGATYPTPLPGKCPDLEDSRAISASFSAPAMPPGYLFQARILPGVKLPPPVRLPARLPVP